MVSGDDDDTQENVFRGLFFLEFMVDLEIVICRKLRLIRREFGGWKGRCLI